MHLEGGAWQYLAIDHYNSWQDFATDEAATTPAGPASGKDPWSQIRVASPTIIRIRLPTASHRNKVGYGVSSLRDSRRSAAEW